MTTRYLLDTDVSSYIICGRHPQLLTHLEEPGAQFCVSAITAAELLYGASLKTSPRLQQRIDCFLEHVQVLDWDVASARAYATIRADLTRAGKPIGYDDMMIAAAALTASATLVTHNLRHFERVHGLSVVDWLQEPPVPQ